MTLFGSIFGKKPTPLNPEIRKAISSSIEKDWKRFVDDQGKIKRSYINGPQKETYDAYFIRLALRILEAENATDPSALSEQGQLRLFAAYNAFQNDVYLTPTAFRTRIAPRRRDDVFPQVLEAMGKDGFKQVILDHQKSHDEIRMRQNEEHVEEAPIRAEHRKSKVPFHKLPIVEQLKLMNKDDWHQLIKTFNFDNGEKAIAWLVDQPALDMGSAVHFIMVSDLLSDLANPPIEETKLRANTHQKNVYTAIQNIITGYYSTHEFAAFDDPDDIRIYEKLRSDAAKQGGPRFTIPEDVLAFQGVRNPSPRYTFDGDNKVVYEYEFWKSHVLSRP